jgi:hypothetical protein
MRKLIFILLFPLLGFSQADLGLINSYAKALELQNGVRTWYEAAPLIINPALEIEAQLWADQMAGSDTFENSPYDSLQGESIYWTLLSNNIADPYYDATIGWILDVTKENKSPFLQMIYPNATSVGFGRAESKNAVYIVAKYDKLYE